MEFAHPEKISTHDGTTTYSVGINTRVEISRLRWSGKTGLHPDLSVQDVIDATKNVVLEELVKNRTMFRTPPTLASLRTIAPMWGFVILEGGKRIEWSQANSWDPDMTLLDTTRDAMVLLVLKGVQISRQAIRPVWNLEVLQILPELDPMDLDFGDDEGEDVGSDISSVDSFEIATVVTQPFALRDKGERKRQAKSQVRAALARAAEAQMAADAAVDHFHEEFDLSEGESDFSDDE